MSGYFRFFVLQIHTTNKLDTSAQKNKTLKNSRWLLLFIAGLTLIFFLADILLGSVKIPLSEFFAFISGKETHEGLQTIIFDFRIPKAITAVLAGVALSVSGLQMQTIFRNPLAGPYVLGISAGASFGVAILIMGAGIIFPNIQLSALNHWAQIVAAWIGSAIVLFLILAVSVRVRDIMTILILGILFGSAISAFVSILQYFTDQSMLKIFVIWSMGSLGSLTISQLSVLIPGIILGLVMVFFSSKLLNVLLLGENYAKSMGMNIKLTRVIVFLSTSILAGSITAFCGPIGFIGIAVPHIARFVFHTSDHRILTPASILIGASIMLCSDLISQLPGQGVQLPINSVTSLVGIPVVIWIILRNKKISDFT
ncbi:MAG: iron ABC transporter permease [Bacteroidales bacterium]|nr:iron ABC transporter permease [Bacteroidales bacterium]